jgi:hypothetical protein
MVNNWETVTSTSWFQVSNNEDYLMQNRGVTNVIVKANATEPTEDAGSFLLPPNGLVNSSILPGVIWVKADTDDTLVVYAK